MGRDAARRRARLEIGGLHRVDRFRLLAATALRLSLDANAMLQGDLATVLAVQRDESGR